MNICKYHCWKLQQSWTSNYPKESSLPEHREIAHQIKNECQHESNRKVLCRIGTQVPGQVRVLFIEAFGGYNIL